MATNNAPTQSLISIKDLKIDLLNFRTIPQPDEIHAVQAMVSISPDYFWGLMESLLDDGYLPIESVLVLRKGPSELIVKEGNRRIASLKLIYGYLPNDIISLPDNIASKIAGVSNEWKLANEKVPCVIYESKDEAKVDKIISLAHGKGEKAGKDKWKAIARARHNRNINNNPEPGLDLLEKYLEYGMNVTPQQARRWAGDYPLTILDEAIVKIASRFGLANASDLARCYPAIQYRDILEEVIKDIGLKKLGFKAIRDKSNDFLERYSLPNPSKTGTPSSSQQGGTSSGSSSGTTGSQGSTSSGGSNSSSNSSGSSASNGSQNSTGGSQGTQGKTGNDKKGATSINDPRTVMKAIKLFKPKGNNREKVVTLRDEMLELDLTRNPLAFCFLLRSMFEISAKAYCEDHKSSGLSYVKPDGRDKQLASLLGEITKHLTNNNKDTAKVKLLHGSLIELTKTDGILSVTSMNQLVHNPKFSTTATDICNVFNNIFPLLEAMNE